MSVCVFCVSICACVVSSAVLLFVHPYGFSVSSFVLDDRQCLCYLRLILVVIFVGPASVLIVFFCSCNTAELVSL